MNRLIVATMLFLFLPPPLQAQEINVIPESVNDLSDMINNGLGKIYLGSPGLEIQMTASCFARNLRSVANPIGRSSRVEMTLDFKNATQEKYKTIQIDFPSQIVQKNNNISQYSSVRILDASKNVLSDAESAISGNTLRANINDIIILSSPLDANGNTQYGDASSRLNGIKFNQVVDGYESVPLLDDSGNPQKTEEGDIIYEYLPNDTASPTPQVRYHAADGTLTAVVRTKFSNDGRKLEINAAFPGEVGYCGGYYSPLALFFDKNFKEAQMTNITQFPLDEHTYSVYWPQPEDQVHFLALDKNKDGKINNGKELFGRNDEKSNGFEALSKWDSNKDNVIDSKDPVFSKLLLWWDKNGNGVSEPNELQKLKQRHVSSISLKYDDKRESNYGNRARARERAKFTYKKAGKVVKGDIIDLWFASTAQKPLAKK